MHHIQPKGTSVNLSSSLLSITNYAQSQTEKLSWVYETKDTNASDQ